MYDASRLFYFASFASMSLALLLAVQEISIRRQSRRDRQSSRHSSRTPLLGRRPLIDEEQGAEAHSYDQRATADSILSLYGTFSDYSLPSFPMHSDLTAEILPEESCTSTSRPLLPWGRDNFDALPSMPESFAATYQLIKTFSRISMAPVHLVKHRVSGEQLIIKQLQSRPGVGDQCLPMEAFILTKVLGSHKNVLGVKDVHTAQDGVHVPYSNMVMPFCRSGDLHGLISKFMKRGEPVPPQFVLHFVSGMIDALAFLHHGHASYDPTTRRPVVVDQPVILHCDIKPDNIFLDLTKDSAYGLPNILLADFGLSAREGVKGIRGTPVYFPPELLEANTRASEELGYWKKACNTSFCSKQSDMYSFAATLYTLITFERYVPGDDIETAFYTSNVRDYVDILFILESGLSEWAEDRELAKSWHHVSFTYKQTLKLWHDAGGRLPSWYTNADEQADAAAGASRSPQVNSEQSALGLFSVGECSGTSSVYEAVAHECDDLVDMLNQLEEIQ